jgi:hypothetical protein
MRTVSLFSIETQEMLYSYTIELKWHFPSEFGKFDMFGWDLETLVV